MTITRPRIWYVCDKCKEWFYYEDKIPSSCPDCHEGKLIKTCAICANKFNDCSCSKEELKERCHKCGFLISKCICHK